MKRSADRILFAVDLAGTFVFAIEGAMTAVAARLDILGIMVLAFATALGGGIIRDLLLGATPPRSIQDWRYPAVAFLGAAVVCLLYPLVRHAPVTLLVGLDAAGLALFAMAGTAKSVEYKAPALVAVLLGGVTGVGGGTIRDMLLSEVPRVLHSEIYGVAALIGGTVFLVASKLKAPSGTAMVLGGVVCFAVRMVSFWQGWNLPKVIVP